MALAHIAHMKKAANICLAVSGLLLFFGCFGSPNIPGTFVVGAIFAAVPIAFGSVRLRIAGAVLLVGALAAAFFL